MYHGWMLGLIRVYPLSSTTCSGVQTWYQTGTAMSPHLAQHKTRPSFMCAWRKPGRDLPG